jgi:SulP family sulfate permease
VLETLISAKIAAGRVDRGFDELKELRGLVIGHAVCGVTGAMPPTGVFVRTSLNTSLGATHRFAQLLNSIVVAIISLAVMPLFSYLPQATIAAILVVASIRMTPMTYLKKLWKEDKVALALCLVTAAICVGEDPVIGLAAGMAIALLLSAKTFLRSRFVDIECKPIGEGFAYIVFVRGPITYVNAEAFTKKVRSLKQADRVTLDLACVRQMDHDGIEAIGKAVKGWKTETWIQGVTAEVYPVIAKADWFLKLESEGFVRKLESECFVEKSVNTIVESSSVQEI